MPKARNPKAEVAEALFLQGIKLIDIANKLNLPEGTVRRWKSTYKWNSERSDKKKANVRNKKGAPKGNKNAEGNEGGAAPLENKNAEKHGLFSKYLPAETLELVEAANTMNPLDVLWQQISIQFAAIIRSQKIMHVRDSKDKTIEKVQDQRGKLIGEKWEVQQAWDKQANYLQAQARAMTSLNGMIKTYDELLHKNWDMATEEQRARISKIKAETGRITGEDLETEDLTETDGDIYG